MDLYQTECEPRWKLMERDAATLERTAALIRAMARFDRRGEPNHRNSEAARRQVGPSAKASLRVIAEWV